MHCKHWFLIATLLVAGVGGALAGRPVKDRQIGPVILNGLEDTQAPNRAAAPRLPRYQLDECSTPNGQCDTTGSSWYDLGSNGTMGRQVAVDPAGYVHCVFTKGVNEGSSVRHVFYNVFDPASGAFAFPGGVQIDASSRAGFVTLAACWNGFAFPAFHQVTGANPHAAVAIDYLPGIGAFTTVECATIGEEQNLWPHIAIDRNCDLHMVAKESGGAGNEYYEFAHPIYADDSSGLDIECDGWSYWPMDDWFITMDVAASRQSDLVAVAWISQTANPEYPSLTRRDIYLAYSHDLGQTWDSTVNVTRLTQVDSLCVSFGGDPMVCNGDTMEPWLDLNILIDNDDHVHLAFDGSAHYYFDTDGTWLDAGLIYSTIWHWDDQTRDYHFIDQAWYGYPDTSGVTLGVNMLMCHRPTMALDTTNGNLYMVYQKFDTTSWSESLHGDADLWITKSADVGQHWTVPTNLTQSSAGPAYPCGEGMHERDPSVATFVSNGTLYLQYTFDKDAGTNVSTTPEGCVTNNPIILSQIPITDLANEPVQSPYPFHADSSGFPGSAVHTRPYVGPENFALLQNFPNPFNPSTTIEFVLKGNAPVTLEVFDLTGRLVKTLIAREVLGSGLHSIEFDATSLASGVYLYQLTAGRESAVKKMVLLR